MEKLNFVIDGHSFSTVPNTAADREKCIEEILAVTGKRYDWFKEITGNKNWILYDTEQYEVEDFDSIEHIVLDNRLDEVEVFLRVKNSFRGKLHLPINASACSFLFTKVDVTKLNLIEFDTSEVVDMSYIFMKANLGDSFSPETTMSKFNTSKVTVMNDMFELCNVNYLNLQKLDVRNVTDFSNMFRGCNTLIDVNLNGWDTNSAEDFYAMFCGCRTLTKLNIAHFKTSKVFDMTDIFFGCNNLEELNLTGWDFSKVLGADLMFACCDKLKRIIVDFNFKVVNDISGMFDGCFELNNINLTNADLSNIENLSYMFINCESLTDVRFNQIAMPKVENINYMFKDCKALAKLVMPNIDFAAITQKRNVFTDCINLKEIYIKKSVELNKMQRYEMFKDCKAKMYQL